MLFVMQFISVLLRLVTRREPNIKSGERQRENTAVTLLMEVIVPVEEIEIWTDVVFACIQRAL